MKIEINEMKRVETGDVVSIEGKVIRALKPNSNNFEGKIVWSQFIVLKDSTGEQGAWLKLDGEEDKVSKDATLKIKGKVGKEYKDSKGKIQRSLNNCTFEGDKKEIKSTGSTGNGNGREEYWAKKFEWDKKVQALIIRECAIKSVTELAKIPQSKSFLIKVHTEKDFFEFADKIETHIRKKRETVKKERIEKAEEIVRETRFKPASTAQKKIIFGYRDKEGWHKGIIESRYIEKHEIKEIGDPKKLSVEKASKWIEFWWGEQGNPEDIGARKQREIENPRDENGKLVNALVKGDKTSLVKDVLIDDICFKKRKFFER